jgi:RNA-directed DNA polymerase
MKGKILKYKKKHPWYRSRGYLHFDRPISFNTAKKIVSSSKKVATHSFHPLISYSVDSKKIKQDKKTRIIETKHKQRPIAYSAHVDSHIYAYYSNLLKGLYEKESSNRGISDSVLAFRTLGKSNIEFAHEAFTKIKEFGSCGVVALDLSKFFDTLDHKILKQQWCNLVGNKYLPVDHYNVFKSITRFSQVEKTELYKLLEISLHNPKKSRTRICEASDFRNIVRKSGLIKTNNKSYGIPQGSPISALLSNIYMLDFDEKMIQYVSRFKGSYFRYCDDMLFIVPAEKMNKIAGIARVELKALNVDINTNKTEIREFTLNNGALCSEKPLQYLGFLFDGQNVFLRSSSLARYSERMRRGVSLAKATMRKRNKLKINRGEKKKPLFKSKIYNRYSYFGSRNFITYGHRAAKIMESETIKKQLKPLWNKLQNEIK